MTPAGLIAQVRASRTVADAAEVRILQLAIEWAHAHPEPEDPENPRPPWEAPSHGFTPDGMLTDGAPDVETDASVDWDDVEWFGIPPIAWDAPARSRPRTGCPPDPGSA